MRPTSAASLLLLASLCGSVLTRPAAAWAQTQSSVKRADGRIHGAVEDSTGAPIPQVKIGIVGTPKHCRLD